MGKEFIPYELALKLKELGFDEECFRVKLKNSPEHWYTQTDYEDYPEQKEEEVLIPLWQQAFDWFRKKHNLFVSPFQSEKEKYFFEIGKVNSLIVDHYSYERDTYEEARQSCLEKLIQIIADENNPLQTYSKS